MNDSRLTLEQIAVATLMIAPSGVDEITAVYNTVGAISSLGFYDNSNEKVSPSVSMRELRLEVLRKFDSLRVETYAPTIGAFYRARVTVKSYGEFSVNYDYNTEPEFDFPVDFSSYAEDLEEFPRDPETYPVWLVNKL